MAKKNTKHSQKVLRERYRMVYGEGPPDGEVIILTCPDNWIGCLRREHYALETEE